MPSEFEQALAALERLELRPRQTGPNQWKALCPVHDERNPSFGLAQGRDGRALYRCFVCDATVDDFRNALGIERNGTLDEPQAKPLPSEADLTHWHRALMDSPKALAAVLNVRGWSELTLSTFGVGLDRNTIVLPQRAFGGELVNVARYIPNRSKPQVVPGHPRILYPEPEHFPGGVVWIVEGEPDSLSACELRIRGVGLPGVNGWRQEYAQRFTGRSVKVCLDLDAEGRRASGRVLGDLWAEGIEAERIVLPSTVDKYDLTDFLLEAQAANAVDQARKWLAKAGES